MTKKYSKCNICDKKVVNNQENLETHLLKHDIDVYKNGDAEELGSDGIWEKYFLASNQIL